MTAHLGPIGPTNFGFKMVDEANLLVPDPVMLQLATSENGIAPPLSSTDLLVPLLQINLNEPVPTEVRRAFYFARNAMCYAFWYYPLITLGSQQILRVGDLATRLAGEANRLRPHQRFGPRISQLRAAGVIELQREVRWNTIVRMRNSVTHPDWQQTWSIAQTIEVVRAVAEEITALSWSKGGNDDEVNREDRMPFNIE